MPEHNNPLGDDFGEVPLDRSGGKIMGTQGGGGSGGFIDESYAEALRILRQEHTLPKPWEQRALMMESAEGAELARRLTTLRHAVGRGLSDVLPTMDDDPAALDAAGAVEALIAALQVTPVEQARVEALRAHIVQQRPDLQAALADVLDYEAIHFLFEGGAPSSSETPPQV